MWSACSRSCATASYVPVSAGAASVCAHLKLTLFTPVLPCPQAGGENVGAFDDIFVGVSGNDQHNAADADVANSFYNMASDFYEYGWGDSFHFGYRHISQGHGQAIQNSQHLLAQKLQVGDMDRVADFGCGIGGPLRGVVRLTGANVTGITINQHQVSRARRITSKMTPYFQERAHYMVQDYLNVDGLEPESFDAVWYMESSLHCENHTDTFKEAFKVLKPGGRLVAFEYVLLDGWDETNPEHQELMRLHLWGNGAARTPTVEEDLQMFKDAGFEILEHFDNMVIGEELYGEEVLPWWLDLQMNWRFHLLPAHPWVRRPLATILDGLSYIGLIPRDVAKAAHLMNAGGDGLSGLGKVGAITPQYVVVARKPLA